MTKVLAEPELIELTALGRRYVGLAHRARVEGLARWLRLHAVAQDRNLAGGRKLILTLDGGSQLTLDVF